MIANLQPYPDYRQSDQAWLGRVPQHWPVLPNRALFAEVKDREHPDEEMLSVTITKGIIRQKALLTDSSKKDSSRQDKSAYKLVQPRDIAYNKMRAWQGAIGASDFRGIISPAYVVMRLREHSNLPRYFHHLYRTPYFAKEAERWSYGITSDMWSLRPEHFKMIYTPQPPPEEQAAIVRFLDYANGRLERAIRAKRKVIALLHEQKQAIIHRAVTRGLDPTVPLKYSGIPWLGDIPQHWEIVPLKFLCHRTQNGATPPSSEQHYYENGSVPWFGPSSVGTASELGAPVRHLNKVAFADGKARLISGPAILVIVIGATAGKMGLLVGEGATNQQITAFELKENSIVPQFGIQQLRSSENWLKSTASTATIPILDSGIVKRLLVAFPPCGEQQAILLAVSLQTQPLTTAIWHLEREIELLREYRTRLVADLVTGNPAKYAAEPVSLIRIFDQLDFMPHFAPPASAQFPEFPTHFPELPLFFCGNYSTAKFAGRGVNTLQCRHLVNLSIRQQQIDLCVHGLQSPGNVRAGYDMRRTNNHRPKRGQATQCLRSSCLFHHFQNAAVFDTPDHWKAFFGSGAGNHCDALLQ